MSIRALLFELLAAVAPGGWGMWGSDSAGSGRAVGPAAARRRRGRAGGSAVAVAALLAAAGGGDQLQHFSILEHIMFLSLRKTDCFTSMFSPRSRLTILRSR